MATTLTIPLVTLPVGTLHFGPSTAADLETGIVLTVDRTVAGGLNSLTGTTQIDLRIEQSNDSGGTWQQICGATIDGGLYQNKHGVNYTASTVSCKLWPGTARQLRAKVIVSGTSVAVAGTLVTQ